MLPGKLIFYYVFLLLAFIAGIFFSCFVSLPNAPSKLKQTVTNYRIDFNGTSVSASLGEREAKKSDLTNAQKRYRWVWGYDGRIPDRTLSFFHFILENEIFVVPDFAYDDLFDLDLTSIDVTKNNLDYVFSVKGGDAESAYLATFFFERNGKLRYRRVIYRDGSGYLVEADLSELKLQGARINPRVENGQPEND